MSTSARDSVFLQEMGIGPLWTLRDGAAGVADEAYSDELAAPAQQAAPQPAAVPVPTAVPTAVPSSVPTAMPTIAAVVMPPPPVVARAAPPAVSPATSPATDSAWGEEPPAPPPTDDEIAAMDWAQLKNAIANCTRCGLCKGGRKPVYGNGAQQAHWLVAAGASTASDEKARQPVSGEPGKLLANMLAAVDLSRESNVYVTNLIKCRPTSANGGDRAPSAEEALACRPYLDRELALSGASMVLTLGQIAANALRGKPLQEALAGARGQVHELAGVKLVATLHPGELLRRGADKALAWADLCLAREHDERRA
ncbi:uracil-DNA glycosylase [Massilia sp. CCM 8734]|uniref:uracil-DNA glycosylase n=1 Tax=Massilia sp. CCM 8734 TaxID=2609283 RepID=UPI00141E3245|nr:uracil-DNA glycosylase [Massilia sp. CCM 8734]NHZ96117.1 uracil-DNA glycosylase [Massilia sp. CCM 8734]